MSMGSQGLGTLEIITKSDGDPMDIHQDFMNLEGDPCRAFRGLVPCKVPCSCPVAVSVRRQAGTILGQVRSEYIQMILPTQHLASLTLNLFFKEKNLLT